MGMYCCCEIKIPRDCEEWYNKCKCDWKEWVSVYDWPPSRKNDLTKFSLPTKEGRYLTRYQNSHGDHYEIQQNYSKTPRKERDDFFYNNTVDLYWSGSQEEQPYAWRELKNNDLR